jgi:ribosomal protein L14
MIINMNALIVVIVLGFMIVIALKKAKGSSLSEKIESVFKSMYTGLYHGLGNVVIRKKKKTSRRDEQYVSVDDEKGNLMPDEPDEKPDNIK